MFKVLVTSRSFAKGSDKAIRYLEENGCRIDTSAGGQLGARELAALVPGYDALIVGIDHVDATVIAAADRLKVICMHGTGIDHIDVAAASARGIYVGNAPGGNNNAVAELAVGLMIAVCRHIPYADSSVRQNGWQRRLGMELAGKTLGLVGLGFIGKRVVELLSGFGMDYLAFDRCRDEDFAARTKLSYVSLDELLRQADIVSVHLPLTPETTGIISIRELALMKRSAVLVNTARGAIVDEQALYGALKEGRPAGAALDAFTAEPLPAESPLRGLDNIILTSHIAASTAEAADNVSMVNARTIISVLRGGEPFSVVNAGRIGSGGRKV
jgi:D-3-phosphoglycerate dehydrogenase